MHVGSPVRLIDERVKCTRLRKTTLTEYQIASLAVPLFVGLLQCGLIGWGIWELRGSDKSRDANNAALLGMGAALQSQSAILADIGAALRSQSAGIQALLKEREAVPPPR